METVLLGALSGYSRRRGSTGEVRSCAGAGGGWLDWSRDEGAL